MRDFHRLSLLSFTWLQRRKISAVLGVVATVVGLAEKYGPEVYETVASALEQSKSKTGPTADQIAALFAKCTVDNAAIQAS